MEGIVLIPAYKPNEELVKLVEQLSSQKLNILVVNDGSGDDYLSIFEQIQDKATVISHDKNRGKGSALKTGIKYVKENLPSCDYFITADSDGQHRAEDIFRVKEKMENGAKIVLTTRVLRGKIPFRSKFGNMLSSFIYTMLAGKYYTDNQSGLRGFSVSECDWLLTVKGSYYDYEMNVIYHADRQKIAITVINIATVYINGNSSSHFNPIVDTARIYRQLFLSALGSFISIAVIEALLFYGCFVLGYLFAPELFIFTMPLIGLFGYFVNMIFTKSIFLRNIHTRDYIKILIRTLIRFISYAIGCLALYLVLPQIPIFLNYNIVLFFIIIPEYFIIKCIYLIKYKNLKKYN